MKLGFFSNTELHNNTCRLASEERRVSTEVLHHLAEVYKRRLHLELGYSSIHDYAVRALKYSESAASRRVSAMRTLNQIPEIEQSLKTGALSVTTVSMVEAAFRKNADAVVPVHVPTPLASEPSNLRKPENKLETIAKKKKEVLKSLEGKSKKEVEKTLVTLFPQALPQEKERPLTPEKTELKIVVSQELLEKLKKIQNLVSHKLKEKNYAELLEYMADLVLSKTDPEKKKTASKPVETRCDAAPLAQPNSKPNSKVEKAPSQSPKPRTRYIPQNIKREVWVRDKGKCQYIDAKTGQTCGSTYQIQLDHVIPWAKNGETSVQNLRCLCSAHNAYKAELDFGRRTI